MEEEGFEIKSLDKIDGADVAEGPFKNMLHQLPWNKTANLPSSLKLYTGMPVALKCNKFVPNGLTNGSVGKVIKVEGDITKMDQLLVIVAFEDYEGPSYSNLPNGYIPIMAETDSFKLEIGVYGKVI